MGWLLPATLRDRSPRRGCSPANPGIMSWYAKWFSNAMYMELYSHRDATEARDAVHLFIKTTGLPAGSEILDLACGTGRHAFEFARSGYAVTGADLSPTLLIVARRKTQRYQNGLSLVRADMRQLPFRRAFDAVAQLFTAFGYFSTNRFSKRCLAFSASDSVGAFIISWSSPLASG